MENIGLKKQKKQLLINLLKQYKKERKYLNEANVSDFQNLLKKLKEKGYNAQMHQCDDIFENNTRGFICKDLYAIEEYINYGKVEKMVNISFKRGMKFIYIYDRRLPDGIAIFPLNDYANGGIIVESPENYFDF